MNILFFFSLIWALYKSIHFIYLFQIKEYRFDRFFSYLKEYGIFRLLYSLELKRPALSVRNILLTLSIGSVSIAILYGGFVHTTLLNTVAILTPVAPLLALSAVAGAIALTSVPAYMYRSWIIQKAAHKMKKTKAVVIGITGSYGKTSVKEYLYHILSNKYKVAKTDKNMNSDVGIALSILRNLHKDTEYFIVELGAYKRGEVRSSVAFVPPHHAILTPLGNQHVDLYGSRQALIEEETYPLTKVPKDGKVYLFDSAPDIPHIAGNTIRYGLSPGADIRARDVKTSSHGTSAIARYNNRDIHIKCTLLGKHAITNLLPAIACALDRGMDKGDIERAIKAIKPLYGKLSVHHGRNNSVVLHDGLTANIDGFIAALEVMSLFVHKQKLVLTQGVIELGGEKRESYQRVVDALDKYHGILLTTDKLFEEYNNNNIITFNDVSSLIQYYLSQVDKDTLTVVEGRFSKHVINQIL